MLLFISSFEQIFLQLQHCFSFVASFCFSFSFLKSVIKFFFFNNCLLGFLIFFRNRRSLMHFSTQFVSHRSVALLKVHFLLFLDLYRWWSCIHLLFCLSVELGTDFVAHMLLNRVQFFQFSQLRDLILDSNVWIFHCTDELSISVEHMSACHFITFINASLLDKDLLKWGLEQDKLKLVELRDWLLKFVEESFGYNFRTNAIA